MGKNSPANRFRKGLVVLLLGFCSAIFSYELEVLPDKPITGRVITLKIITKIENTSDLEVITDVILPDDFAKISGPVKSVYAVREGNRYVRYYQLTWALRAYETGIYNLQPVKLLVNGNEVELEFPLVRVFSSDETKRVNPIKVKWQDGIKKDIYVGETLPLIIEAINLDEIIFPESISSRTPSGGIFERVSGLGSIELDQIRDLSLYRVSIGSWLFTPFEPGRVVIPSIQVKIDGQIRNTGELILNVRNIPTDNSSRGVGEFIITTRISKTEAILDENIHFVIRIEGMGNLPYFNIPDIDQTGLILLEKKENSSVSHGLNGYMGWREIEYILQPIDIGLHEIVVPSLSWVDKTGRVSYYNGQRVALNVVEAKLAQEELRPYLSLYNTKKILNSNRIELYRIPLLWLGMFISTAIHLLLMLKKVITNKRIRRIQMISVVLFAGILLSVTPYRKAEIIDALERGNSYIEEGEYEKALEIYMNLQESIPNNYGLLRNMSILYDKLGNKPEAIYYILAAERIFPNFKDCQDIKKYLAGDDENYRKQARPVSPVNPDYIFIGIIILLNILFYYLLKYKKGRKISSMSVIIVLLIAFVFLLVSLIYIHSKNTQKIGVISTEFVDVKKVPTNLSLDWLQLEKGYSVYVRSEWEDKYQIETEYGLKGWIPKNSLIILGEKDGF